MDRFEDGVAYALGVVEHDTAEADVYRGWTGLEEFVQVRGRLVCGRGAEEEAADVWAGVG